MFSLINLILSIIILIRLFKYDKFYLLQYDMKIREVSNERRKDKK